MSATGQTTALQVIRFIANRFNNRTIPALFALAQAYKETALNDLRAKQAGNGFWNNQTYQALQRVYGEAFKEPKAIGFYLAHGVQYGIYLELANDRQNEALRPTIDFHGRQFILSAQKIMRGENA